jgi:maltose-binding protein MalE
MLKRKMAFALACLMSVGILAGCQKTSPASTPSTTKPSESTPKVLKIWSFTDEVKTYALAYQKEHPEVKVEYTMIPMTNGEFQTKLKSTLQSGDVPDVVSLEISFVKEYVESTFLADISDLSPLAKDMKTYQYTLDIGSNAGKLKALSYQATPGAMFYRRSLAKKYLGTDDPVQVQAMVSDMNKFKDVAKKIKDASSGDTYMVASTGDFANLYFANRMKPWVENDKLVIDPKVNDLLDMAKEFRQNGYEAQATQWQEGWFAGMNDSLIDPATKKPKQVFSYLLPTWGLPYVLMQNGVPKDNADKTAKVGKDTTGDWACISGPMPYFWGGTYVGAIKNAKNLDTAKDFIKFMTLNETTLKNWATGVYNNAYLKAVDKTIGDTLGQGPGDFVSSQKVVESIVSSFDNSDASKFIGGQNSYKAFQAAAPLINAKLIQASDDAIQRALNDPMANYASGKGTKEETIKAFKEAVKNALPDVKVE